MTEEIESQPVEIPKAREETENTEGQKLDDATLEPMALTEQTGDFRQAEILQEAFTGIVENAEEMTAPEIQMVEGMAIPASGSEQVPMTTLPGQRAQEGDGQQPPPPDQNLMEPVPLASPESEEQGTGIPMEASVLPFVAENQEAEQGSMGQPIPIIEESVLNMEQGADSGVIEGSLIEGQAVILAEALGEAEEGWIPITGMYIHYGGDGTKTVVDANGKPVDSPPLYHFVVNEKGIEIYYAYYPTRTGQTEVKGILSTYSAPITDMYIHYGGDGTKTVVDANGKPVDSPPLYHFGVDEKGNEIYYAYYPATADGKPEVKAILTAYVPNSGTSSQA